MLSTNQMLQHCGRSWVWQKKRKKIKEESQDRQSGKTLSHSASCLRKGSGWRHLVLCHSQTVETGAIFNIKCTGGVESCPAHWIHSSASGQPSYSVHYCVRLREEEKKEEGAEEGKKTCLFVWERLSRKVILWLFEFASKARLFPRPTGTSRRLCAVHHSHIWVCFSGQLTATPGLLLMMRADVRLVSMNIDVEDSLFHRRTEGGKMAAL